MTREEIRERTMRIVFQMEATGVYDVEKLTLEDDEKDVLGKKQAAETLSAIYYNKNAIDELISENIDMWKLERLPKADLAIIRLAVCEMRYIDNIPVSVSINEAVELAKKYGEEKSYAFVNSVLGKIAGKI